MGEKGIIDMYIYLNKEIIEDLTYTNMDIAVYIALRKIYITEKQEFYISVKMIGYELYGMEIPVRALGNIKESVFHLEELGLFDIVSKLSSDEFIIREKKLYFEKYSSKTQTGSYFIIIDSKELNQIGTLETNRNKISILRFFVNIIGSINVNESLMLENGQEAKKGFVGFMPQKYLGIISNINVGVVEDYFAVLEDAKILYVYRHNKGRFNEFGEVRSLPNHYGRYRDREYIKQYAINYEQRFDCFDSTSSNHKRSLAAKYNFLVANFEKGIAKYSEAELIEIFEYIHERNIQIPRKEDGTFVYSEDEKKVKDEAIFNRIPCVAEYITKTLNDNCNTSLLDEILNNDDLFETEKVEEGVENE